MVVASGLVGSGWTGCLDGYGLTGGGCLGWFHLEVRQPAQPAGQIPAALAEQAQGAREDDQTDQRRSRERDAAVLAGVLGGGGGVGAAGWGVPDQDPGLGLFQPPAVGLLAAVVAPA